MGKKTILMTGGSGFLGQYVVKELLKQDPSYHIRILDLKPNPLPVHDFSTHPRVDLLLGKDICKYATMHPHFKDVDVVIHLAGIVSFSLKDKELLHKVHVQGTRNVLKAMKKHKVQQLIHISSVAALGYNDEEHQPIDESFAFDWDIATQRKKYYMLTKHLAGVEIAKTNTKAVLLYPGLMFGPGDLANSSRLFKALKQKKIPFHMPGGTNIIDVRDVARGIALVVKKNVQKGHYLLSGHNLTLAQVNTTMAEAVGVDPPKHTFPKALGGLLSKTLLLAETISPRKLPLTGDNVDSACRFRYFKNTRAQRELGWKPKISFEKTIQDTKKWMDKHGLFTQ